MGWGVVWFCVFYSKKKKKEKKKESIVVFLDGKISFLPLKFGVNDGNNF
jgi:hypothetical protein